MTPCTAEQLCRAVNGTLLQGSAALAGDVTTDSRHVPQDALFVPLAGEKFDGHAYLESALRAGASGCLCARRPEALLPGKFYILVDDTLLALKALASWYRGEFDLPVVQITGSAGKTTTKEMVAAVLARRLCTLKTEANYNNAIGTPLTLLHLAPAHQAAVIETGMNHFGEIRYLGEMVRPTAALITNVGDAHIENLGGTRQGTLQAKCEIFENLQPGGLAVLNGDDALLGTLRLPFSTVLCGRGAGCTVRVTEETDRGIEGISCTVTTARDTYHLEIPAPGSYMVYPAAMAVAVGEQLGLSREEITAGVADYRPTGSRMRLVQQGDRLLIDDCYNANPQAMAEALGLLARTSCGRKIAVLGDMGELGALSEKAHTDLGALCHTLQIDALVAIGEKAAATAAAFGGEVYHFDTVAAAMPTVARLYTPGTALLVKASHAMDFSQIVRKLEDKL